MNLSQIKKIRNNYKIIKRELTNVIESGYIGKRSYKFTLNDGTIKHCDQITKSHSNGDAVVIIPILKNGNYLLIIESRPLTKEETVIEFPAGMVDENEKESLSALRELQEETGYTSDNIKELEWHYQDQGCSSAIIKTFVAIDCYKISNQKLDESEKIVPIELTENELDYLYKNNKLNDANTKIAYLTYKYKK